LLSNIIERTITMTNYLNTGRNKSIFIISIAVLFLFYLSSFQSGKFSNTPVVPEDSTAAAKGEAIFSRYCSSCHNFRQDGIGPQLGGVTSSVSADWIRHFISDPQKVIESGDEHAQQLSAKYKVVMPPFSTFTDNQVNDLLSFLVTRKKLNIPLSKDIGKELTNPIPQPIQFSGLVADLQLVTQFPSTTTNGRTPLARITKLAAQPKTGDIFVVDLNGKLYKLEQNKPVVYMDMAKLMPNFINVSGYATGFGSFAFHPDFFKNGLLYTVHSEPKGAGKPDFYYSDTIRVALQSVLTEWKVDDPKAAVFSGKPRELLRVNMVTGIHGIQEISFNPVAKPGDKDYGLLYVCVGEGGSAEAGFPFLAHSNDKIWGTVLRIDPQGRNSANGRYGIPRDNPFAQDQNPKTLGEVYAYGFRNPHRISWTKTGKVLVCHIGESNIESVDLLDGTGNDFGWPIREGNFVRDPAGSIVYPLPADDSKYKISYPVAEFDHDEGTAISGGYEYWGTSVPKLAGKYFFGDIATGRLFYINIADIKQGKQATIHEWKISMNGNPTTFQELSGSKRVEIRFGRDSKGELYILSKADGKLYKLVSAH
jgi:glucose/arabinose dehydrogenase/mono/diheme cytochrome c family protein